MDESSGDTVYGWHPEIKQSNENWFAARTIVYATPAVSPGLVTEARLRIGQLKRVDRQEKGILGLGVFQQVSDIVGEEEKKESAPRTEATNSVPIWEICLLLLLLLLLQHTVVTR